MDPVLVHIGYHKTGTNWLQLGWWSDPATGYQWLGKPSKATHPVRRIVGDRPLEFDAEGLRAAFEKHLGPIRAQGLVPVVSFERYSGHPFTGGYDAKEIADRLAATFPEGRVLIVIREQHGMILSTYKQYVSVGGPLPPQQFIDPKGSSSARTVGFDYRHFEYDRLIRYYHSVFGEERVLALPYEQFARDARAYVQRIAEFAGRPLAADVLERLPFEKRMNTGRSALTLELLRRLNRFRGGELNQLPPFDLELADKLAKRVKRSKRLGRGRTEPLAKRAEASLRRVVADAVGDRYVESNRRTAELLGVDLGELGWRV